ncbi:hypothetical protein L9F63_007079, partial [Diploptera punctata]
WKLGQCGSKQATYLRNYVVFRSFNFGRGRLSFSVLLNCIECKDHASYNTVITDQGDTTVYASPL